MKKGAVLRAMQNQRRTVKDSMNNGFMISQIFKANRLGTKSVHRLSHQPFKTEPNYLITEKSRLKQYNLKLGML